MLIPIKANPVLSASPSNIFFGPNKKITVTDSGAPGYDSDWIGLFKANASTVVTTNDPKENQKVINPNTIFFLSEGQSVVASQCENITVETINSIIGDEIVKIIVNKIPKCVLWKYSAAS